MLCTILQHVRRFRPVVAFALLLPAPTAAHEIPSRVSVLMFARPEPGRLRIVLRAPLEAMRDIDFPVRGPGYLDVARADALVREGARTWIANFVTGYENGDRLPPARIVGARIAMPSERTFDSYQHALAGVAAPRLPETVDLPWQQALIDVVLEYPITSTASDLAIEPQLARLGIQTTTVLRFIAPHNVERVYQYNGDPGRIQLDPRWHHAAAQFVVHGVRHILGGFDHLLFILCLLIPFRRLRDLVVIVTAFTVAHSITLVAAARGVVPGALWFPALIEAAIAASILYMALENIVGARLKRRWIVAFGFGLVHGFGFSFALAESLQFAGSHLALSLAAFNVGVEVGQVAVLVAAVPLVNLLFRRVVAERLGVIILSAFIAHTAWHWMLSRGGELRQYQVSLPALDLALLLSVWRGLIVVLVAGAAVWGLAEVYRRMSLEPIVTDGANAQPEV